MPFNEEERKAIVEIAAQVEEERKGDHDDLIRAVKQAVTEETSQVVQEIVAEQIRGDDYKRPITRLETVVEKSTATVEELTEVVDKDHDTITELRQILCGNGSRGIAEIVYDHDKAIQDMHIVLRTQAAKWSVITTLAVIALGTIIGAGLSSLGIV